MTQKEIWDKMVADAASPDDLAENVRRFFAILDVKESSDSSDTLFSPVQISSVRVMYTAKLNEILKAMKQQSGYGGSDG